MQIIPVSGYANGEGLIASFADCKPYRVPWRFEMFYTHSRIGLSSTRRRRS